MEDGGDGGVEDDATCEHGDGTLDVEVGVDSGDGDGGEEAEDRVAWDGMVPEALDDEMGSFVAVPAVAEDWAREVAWCCCCCCCEGDEGVMMACVVALDVRVATFGHCGKVAAHVEELVKVTMTMDMETTPYCFCSLVFVAMVMMMMVMLM